MGRAHPLMHRLLLITVLLAGCHATRVAELEGEIVELTEEIEATRQVVSKMQHQLDRHQRAASTETPADRMPPDYEPGRALPEGDPNRPDILLISIDTLRADHLGSHGYERDTSPFLDELAAGGTRFASAWSPSPWTLPSHTTMLSGLLPPNHGAIEDSVRVGSDIPMVQEAFSANGYRTAAVTSTLFVSKRFGFDRGFDYFYDFDIHGAEMNNASTVDAEHVFAWATQWATGLPEREPAFVFLHLYDAHYGYNAPPPWNEKFDRPSKVSDALYRDYHFYKNNPLPSDQMDHQIAQYDEEIAYVDDAIRQFVQRWRQHRSAVVVVTSDHGEELGERGSWGHAHTLFPEQLHVPWIVNGPGVRSQVVDQRVGTEDIPSTLAGLAGLGFPDGDGTNRSDQVRRGGLAGDGVAGQVAETSRFRTNRLRWHHPPWDLIVDFAHAKRGMCNLAEDPGCRRTALGQDRDQADAMFADLMRWLGTPWEATRAGTVTVENGVIFDAQGKRQTSPLAVSGGARFAVLPQDAVVRFQGPNGHSAGPWAAVGGTLPGERAPLAFHGRRPVEDTKVDLSDQEQEMLEALGYIQD